MQRGLALRHNRDEADFRIAARFPKAVKAAIADSPIMNRAPWRYRNRKIPKRFLLMRSWQIVRTFRAWHNWNDLRQSFQTPPEDSNSIVTTSTCCAKDLRPSGVIVGGNRMSGGRPERRDYLAADQNYVL